MSLAITTMPDDPKDWPPWLEEQLVGDRLGEVVGELLAFHRPTTAMTLADALGTQRKEVLSNGLTVLSPERIRQLVTHPKLLLELQELVLIEGGDYWQAKPVSYESLYHAEKQWHTIAEKTSPAIVPLTQVKARQRANPWMVMLATAASVLIAVVVFDQFRPKPAQVEVAAVKWGWAKPGGIPDAPDAKGYYEGLAASANEWSKERPTDSAQVAKRITEFRQGCSKLIFAEHKALNETQRAELVTRCKKWAGRLDEALALLEKNGDAGAAQSKVDGIVSDLVKYLTAEAAKA